MAKYIEEGTNYAYTIERIENITFTKLRAVAIDFTRRLPSSLTDELYNDMQHGVCQLQSEPALNMYLHSFGLMHEAKLQHAFEHLPSEFTDHEAIEIIDYGCGQAIGTICYADFLHKIGKSQKVKKVTLIEPSERALERAALHTSCFFPKAEIVTINKGFDDLVEDDLRIDDEMPTLHIFSNVLDLAGEYFNLKSFAYLLEHCLRDENQFICIEPYFEYDEKDDCPYKFFKLLDVDELYYSEAFVKGSFTVGKDWTCHIVMAEKYIHCGEVCITPDLSDWKYQYEIRQMLELANDANKERRYSDAYQYYEIAAKNGNEVAMFQLGEYNYYGKGVNKNYSKAIKWYQSAIEYGYYEAYNRIGCCYYNGEGVEQDYEVAVKYFRKNSYRRKDVSPYFASINGCDNAEAQYYLGLCYEEGKGVKANPSEAVKWYKRASTQNSQKAINSLKRLVFDN